MNLEELKKLPLILESNNYAVYENKKISENLFQGYRLDKRTNQIIECKFVKIPSFRVVETPNFNILKYVQERRSNNK